MRFLIDENLPPAFAALAREAGFEAASVREILPAARDAEILDRLSVAGEVLVTRDVRFANLVLAQRSTGRGLAGVVLIREQRMSSLREAWLRFVRAPPDVDGIAVVSERGVRVRRLRDLRR